MIKKIKLWFENKIRKILKKILKDEYYISADIGIRETEIIICKYSYQTGKLEIISDNRIRKTPLKDVEKEIKFLAKHYNASIGTDYLRDLTEKFDFERGF